MHPSVSFARLSSTILAMEIHLRHGGKMRLTRTATPSLLRTIATEYTGKAYPRSTKGMQTALDDLRGVKADLVVSAR
jgi:hypothetical protein